MKRPSKKEDDRYILIYAIYTYFLSDMEFDNLIKLNYTQIK